jgi:peptide chain release factor 2
VFHFDLTNVKLKIETLENEMGRDDFWDEPTRSQELMKNLKSYKDSVEAFDALKESFDDVMTMIELAYEENDESLIVDIESMKNEFITSYEAMRIKTLLSGEYDAHNAILSLHAGAGGTEACDWVAMLHRMYSRWADKKEFKLEVLAFLDGEEAGIKSITFQISGVNVYGYLKAEKGVHRMVRLSPFDSSGRRHTTFASCDVIPEIDDDVIFDIPTDELRIDTYRASGSGGQHINKTDSAIRITHIPTKIVVQCQNERSQHKNKNKAMAMLKAKLIEQKLYEQKSKMEDIRGEVKDISWGNQIRSYVMHPYCMVKDHRTNVETGNVQGVMDGDIDRFINGYLIWNTAINQ